MNKKLSIDEFDELDKEQKNKYLNTLNVFDDNNDPVLLTLKERFIEEHGKTGRLEEVIVSEQYHVFPNTTFTACLLTLQNGYTVMGESACASPENFNEDLGRKIARDNAKNKTDTEINNVATTGV